MTDCYYDELIPEFGSKTVEIDDDPTDDGYGHEVYNNNDILNHLEEVLECKEFYVCNAKDFDNFVIWMKTNHPRIYSKMKKHANFNMLELKVE